MGDLKKDYIKLFSHHPREGAKTSDKENVVRTNITFAMAATDGNYLKSARVPQLRCDLTVGTSVILSDSCTVLGCIVGYQSSEKSLLIEANIELYEKVADAGYTDPCLRYVTTLNRSSKHRFVSIDDISAVGFVFNV